MKQNFSFWFSTFCCFLAFAAFGWHQVQWENLPTGEVAISSTAIPVKGAVELAETCSPDRNYLQAKLKTVPDDYRLTRKSAPMDAPPRECVSYIMQNFMSLSYKSNAFSRCNSVTNKGRTRDVVQTGFKPACVTEDYANSVYNSLVDVTDCLNIPMKDLLPKLYNESGLHVNTLGAGYDAGVGQLTGSALREVFMRYNGHRRNPTTLDWYMREIGKSSKESCKRILKTQSAYTILPGGGRKVCAFGDPAKDGCYYPWEPDNRCVVLNVPQNPLRNVLFTGIFYRTMVRIAAGVNYIGGEDVVGTVANEPDETTAEGTEGAEQAEEAAFGGYIGSGDYIARLQKLGATHADQTMLKQMMVSFGFNGGIRTAKIFLDNYIKQREAKKKALTDADFDFVNSNAGRWAIVSNSATFWRGLSSADQVEYDKALTALEAFKDIGLDVVQAQKQYKELRQVVRKQVKAIDAQKTSAKEKNRLLRGVRAKADKHRVPLLTAVYSKSYLLSFPEFMRIAHGYAVSSTDAGGAPGYLSFLAAKYKQLESEMGEKVCTSEKYLQF